MAGRIALDGISVNGRQFTIGELIEDMPAFCEPCGRCTDHVGEHEDLIEAGLIEYNRSYIGQVSIADGFCRWDIETWWGLFTAFNPNWWRPEGRRVW